MLTENDLAAIEARLKATTPGPWRSMVEGRDHVSGSSFIMTGAGTGGRGNDIELVGASISDQDFIAAARQDIEALLFEIRSLRMHLSEKR
jgi:hypothetical protein